MPFLLFKLNGVPADEAEEVRDLLSAHGIDFYETPEGRWGISVGGIWLRDDSRLAEARRLIDEYQQRRAEHVRADRHDTLWRRLARHPVRTLVYLLTVAAILYLSIAPFLHWR